VGGKEYTFLADTGSCLLAICPDSGVPPGAIAYPNKTNPAGAAMVYEGGNHGWLGNVNVATLQVGNMTPVRYVGAATMTQAVDETGNACGPPAPSSLGSVKVDGIFGFGLTGKLTEYFCPPKPGGYSNFWTPEQISAKKLTSPPGCGQPFHAPEQISAVNQFTSPWQSLLGAQVEVNNMAWGLYWTGEMGTGSLYTGQAAYNMFEHYADLETTVWVEMINRDMGIGNYNFDLFQYTIEIPGEETVTVPFTPVPAGTNFDTGTPCVYLPTQLIEAAQKYFTATKDVDAAVTVNIFGKAPVGAKSVPLTMQINRTQAEITIGTNLNLNGTGSNGDIENAPIVGPPGTTLSGTLGLAIMLWYEAVLVDIGGNKIGFAKRATPILGTFPTGYNP
jgi:hypothetical protein